MTQPASASVPPTVLDILNSSPAGPLLHRPVGEVLAGLGIPPLPQMPPLPPLPGLPPLPTLNPVALLKPVTDSFGHLGSGNLGSMGPLDPTQVLSDVANGLSSVVSLGTTALGLLTSLQGQGAQQAAAKSAAAQSNTASVSEQATGMSALVGAAAGVVEVGNAELAAIAAKLAAELTVAVAVPGGAPFAAAAAAEASAEAAAVIAHVKAELAVLATQMTAVGQPVPITSPPRLPQPAAGKTAATTAKSTATTAKAAATTAKSTAVTAKTAATTAKSAATTAKATTATAANAAASGGSVADSATTAGSGTTQGAQALQNVAQPISQLGQLGAMSPNSLLAPITAPAAHSLSAEMDLAPTGFDGGLAGVATMPGLGAGAPLQETVIETPVDPAPAAHTAPAALAASDYTPAAAAAERSGTPMMPPMGGPGMVGRAGAADVESRSSLVHAQHGEEVVGRLDGLMGPVVGATVPASGPTDKELAL
ncbi:hypothetical protein KO481_15785 [Nocardia sp. NEAU-G5]|uniref:Uncharacterized protein n=1 Tax=Nocardia albiluteola TaxID=2842303 RepID=A0ABS6AY79_9NOCA|nr:hypothetical protein [Nocardia albiluteola]MBU3062979.1 hypothetical protein [Nocardia albiluteola]